MPISAFAQMSRTSNDDDDEKPVATKQSVSHVTFWSKSLLKLAKTKAAELFTSILAQTFLSSFGRAPTQSPVATEINSPDSFSYVHN